MGKKLDRHPTEMDLKQRVIEELRGNVVFVENGNGGTEGFSDCIVFCDWNIARRRRVLGMGLRDALFVEIKKNGDSKLRPSQRFFAEKLIDNGQRYFKLYWQRGLNDLGQTCYKPRADLIRNLNGKLVCVHAHSGDDIMNCFRACLIRDRDELFEEAIKGDKRFKGLYSFSPELVK